MIYISNNEWNECIFYYYGIEIILITNECKASGPYSFFSSTNYHNAILTNHWNLTWRYTTEAMTY